MKVVIEYDDIITKLNCNNYKCINNNNCKCNLKEIIINENAKCMNYCIIGESDNFKINKDKIC
jgi:hypothetical protein